MPGVSSRSSPRPQRRTLGHEPSFFHHFAIRSFAAKVDVFLVNVESDIVWDVHWVLLLADSESALLRWSRHSSPRENPSSSHLSIQTDGTDPNFFSPSGNGKQ